MAARLGWGLVGWVEIIVVGWHSPSVGVSWRVELGDNAYCAVHIASDTVHTIN